jgi:hypothetical protein
MVEEDYYSRPLLTVRKLTYYHGEICCNKDIYVVIPTNSNKITFADSHCNMWRGNRLK